MEYDMQQSFHLLHSVAQWEVWKGEAASHTSERLSGSNMAVSQQKRFTFGGDLVRVSWVDCWIGQWFFRQNLLTLL
jgi:hypothetical protein